MRFSQKIGKTSVRESIQIESIDTKLENRIWNSILNDFFNKIETPYSRGSSKTILICKHIWKEFFVKREDEIPSFSGGSVYVGGVIENLKTWFFSSQWYEKYDLIEFLAVVDTNVLSREFTKGCNLALEKEMSGYRIIDEKIVQITSEEEVLEIEEALSSSSIWEPVNTHLKTALEYLSNRENPDYRNSIKESISSVESLCNIITDGKETTLGKALNIIEKEFQIHGALKNAFSSLYGYTSDSGGIRHSLLEDDITVTMEDAKFMLVSCSAFINYLKVKID